MFKLMKFFTPLFIIFIICKILFMPIVNNKSFTNSNIKIYINESDKISIDKLQVNWKYVAAIDKLKKGKNFSQLNIKNSKDIANLFIETNHSKHKLHKSNYKLSTLDEVLNKLSLNNKQKNKVYKYLDILKDTYIVNVDKGKKEFIEELTPTAIDIYKNYKILPSIIISQAILESNWGKSKLSSKYNNLFGIKSTNSWKGTSIKMKTSENYNDTIISAFRAYDSKKDSLNDYAKFLKNNERYKSQGLFDSNDYISQAKALENAGYSTKQNKNGENIYGDLLIQIIKEYNLQLIDNKVQEEFFSKI